MTFFSAAVNLPRVPVVISTPRTRLRKMLGDYRSASPYWGDCIAMLDGGQPPRCPDIGTALLYYGRCRDLGGRMGMLRVMIVEDDPVFLNRFCGIIAADADFELFAAVPNGAAALDALSRDAPDVLLVDLGLPDMSGIEVIRESSRRYPATDILVVTVFGDDEHVLASIEAGATGYLLKDSLPDEFSEVIKLLNAGGSPINPIIARKMLKRLRPPPDMPPAPDTDQRSLSRREVQILSLIAKGFGFAEIARLLEISPHTVTSYVKKIYQKLAVHSRSEAVYEASKMGLIK